MKPKMTKSLQTFIVKHNKANGLTPSKRGTGKPVMNVKPFAGKTK